MHKYRSFIKVILLCSFILLKSFIIGQNGFIYQYYGLNNETDTASLMRIYCQDNNSLEEIFAVFDTTHKSYTLHLDNKPKFNYQLFDINGNYIKKSNTQANEYKIKFENSELVKGYKCSKISIGLYDDNMDNVLLWVTNEVKDYEKFLNATVNGFDFRKLTKALKNANIEGIPIRIQYLGSPTLFRFDFLRVDMAQIDANLFNISRKARRKKNKEYSKEELKKQNKVSDDQYEAMKQAEEAAKKAFEESKKNKK